MAFLASHQVSAHRDAAAAVGTGVAASPSLDFGPADPLREDVDGSHNAQADPPVAMTGGHKEKKKC